MNVLLIVLGVAGALVDILLHFLQLIAPDAVSPRNTSYITLAGCGLMFVSLLADPSPIVGTLAICITGMALYSLITGKEVH